MVDTGTDGAGAGARMDSAPAYPREIAPGVHHLSVGKGVMRANVYLVEDGADWVLIDAGSPGCAHDIQKAAEDLFADARSPVSILLTHNHPDHAGSLRELVRTWGCGAWVHPADAPLTQEDAQRFHEWANPLDRWLILPYMRLLGRKRAALMVERASLRGVVATLDPALCDRRGAPPGLPGWEVIPTPGHTPGHLAFFRRRDRVAITGDALMTAGRGYDRSPEWRKSALRPAPWFVTVDRWTAGESLAVLAALEPLVVAGGHGVPVAGPEVPAHVRALAERWRGRWHRCRLPTSA